METKKILVIIPFLFVLGLPLFAQTRTQIAPGAEAQLASLLNKPTNVQPAAATPLGRNWFTLAVDTHIFTDEASFEQVVAVMLDLQDQDKVDKIFDGRKSKMSARVISSTADDTIFEIVSITMAPLGIQIRTPYCATIKTIENTGTRFVSEIRQTSDDSASNKNIKNLYASRFVQEVTINGKKYVYIRLYSTDEVNASILPGARNILENNADPANEEAMQLIINSAKTRRL
jgi:hypothetical protein